MSKSTKRIPLISKLVIATILCFVIVALSAVVFYFCITFTTTLNHSKVNSSAFSVAFVDNSGKTINSTEIFNRHSFANIEDISDETINAFVSVEDKRFFEHNGIDYLRILGAIKNNILHPNRKQGGSTISQQVIKNTQLTHEKTIQRKLKEFKLAKKLEKSYSKKQILEMYLNSIYFGNGCYGIESASNYYFNKPSSKLTIAESALLASTINAPSIYDPVSNPDKANSRKDLILKLMLDNKKINTEQYNLSKSEKLVIAKNIKNYKNQYYKGVIAEACSILKVTESQLKNMDAVITTYYNPQLQNQLETLITSGSYNTGDKTKISSIVLDNSSYGVSAFASSNGLDTSTLRQPGSTIKPILVYAPAFDSGKYSPSSFILDEPINIGGYSPENASKSYNGFVTSKTAISKSLNIPAVKVLDDIGINYAKEYATNLGINFENADTNLALALGGFTKGTTIKQLADSYMCFANLGKFNVSSFIKSITGNNISYNRVILPKQVVSDSVAYQISDCLKETVTSGTAKRMQDLNLSVCAKTGTVGSNLGNSDAYNICYTTSNTICTWIGSNDKNNPMPSNVNGATYPTLFNKNVLSYLYKDSKPKDFELPDSLIQVGLNDAALAEHKLEKDDLSNTKAYFTQKQMPPQTNRTNLDTILVINNYENSKPCLVFDAKRENLYRIYRLEGSNLQFLKEYKFVNDTINFTDNSAITGRIYEYFIECSNANASKQSNKIKLLAN